MHVLYVKNIMILIFNIYKYFKIFIFYIFFIYLTLYATEDIFSDSENPKRIPEKSIIGLDNMHSEPCIIFEEIKNEALQRQKEAQEKFHSYDMLKVHGLSDGLKWAASNWHYEAQKKLLKIMMTNRIFLRLGFAKTLMTEDDMLSGCDADFLNIVRTFLSSAFLKSQKINISEANAYIETNWFLFIQKNLHSFIIQKIKKGIRKEPLILLEMWEDKQMEWIQTCFSVAFCYYHGKYVQVDYTIAFNLFKNSAERGFAKAQYYMGLCYYYGEGVGIDHKKSFEEFQKSADQGDRDALYDLGISCRNGEGTSKNLMKAFQFFKCAADKGHLRALYETGLCYYYGKGVKIDYKESFNFLKSAADKKHKEAQRFLRFFYYERAKQNVLQYVDLLESAIQQQFKIVSSTGNQENEEIERRPSISCKSTNDGIGTTMPLSTKGEILKNFIIYCKNVVIHFIWKLFDNFFEKIKKYSHKPAEPPFLNACHKHQIGKEIMDDKGLEQEICISTEQLASAKNQEESISVDSLENSSLFMKSPFLENKKDIKASHSKKKPCTLSFNQKRKAQDQNRYKKIILDKKSIHKLQILPMQNGENVSEGSGSSTSGAPFLKEENLEIQKDDIASPWIEVKRKTKKKEGSSKTNTQSPPLQRLPFIQKLEQKRERSFAPFYSAVRERISN